MKKISMDQLEIWKEERKCYDLGMKCPPQAHALNTYSLADYAI
jgi:hypothetical protein